MTKNNNIRYYVFPKKQLIRKTIAFKVYDSSGLFREHEKILDEYTFDTAPLHVLVALRGLLEQKNY